MVALDAFRYAAAAIVLLAAGGTILLSLGYLERERLLAPEYYPLILLATAGMMFLGRRRGPDRALPRPRGDVGRGLRARRLQPAPTRSPPRPRSSTS